MTGEAIVESIEDSGRGEAAVISRMGAEKKLYRVVRNGRWGYAGEKGYRSLPRTMTKPKPGSTRRGIFFWPG